MRRRGTNRNGMITIKLRLAEDEIDIRLVCHISFVENNLRKRYIRRMRLITECRCGYIVCPKRFF
jgi:hypothetical protein